MSNLIEKYIEAIETTRTLIARAKALARSSFEADRIASEELANSLGGNLNRLLSQLIIVPLLRLQN
ncbi:hypothetical protein CMK22_16645 [Candidatus Poribacteria bacterium]|nr:hypothetical protein [Candidatus Poribacteria bacterium]